MRISDWSSDVCSSDLIAALSMSSMSAMSFVHEHMHEGAQQQDGQWQPAECSIKEGAMLDAKIEDGEERKSVVEGKRMSIRVDLVGRRIIKKKTEQDTVRLQKVELSTTTPQSNK